VPSRAAPNFAGRREPRRDRQRADRDENGDGCRHLRDEQRAG
jgi:hypothetical protein